MSTQGITSTPVSALRKNGFVVIKGQPTHIVELSYSDNEYHIVGTDLFTNAKLKASVADDEYVDVPDVTRREHHLLDCENGVISIQLDSGDTKDDIPLPANEVGDKIKRMFKEEEKDVTVTLLSALGEEVVVSATESFQKCY